jgi:hypothetical protein
MKAVVMELFEKTEAISLTQFEKSVLVKHLEGLSYQEMDWIIKNPQSITLYGELEKRSHESESVSSIRKYTIPKSGCNSIIF